MNQRFLRTPQAAALITPLSRRLTNLQWEALWSKDTQAESLAMCTRCCRKARCGVDLRPDACFLDLRSKVTSGVDHDHDHFRVPLHCNRADCARQRWPSDGTNKDCDH
jgi:hypothetical protein